MATNGDREHTQSSSPPPYVDYSDGAGDTESGTDEIDGRNLHRRLSLSESDDSSIDDKLSVVSIASSIEDQLTWRGRLQLVLHSHYFHYFIVVLVIMDALIVLFELLLDIGALNNVRCEGEGLVGQARFCHYREETGGRTCLPPAELVLTHRNITPAPQNVLEILTDVCVCKFVHGKRLLREAGGVNPALVLHYTSVAILSIFMIEIGLKFFAFRLKYFTHKFEVFDGMVVVLSWVLDVASLQEESALEVAALLIVLRLWRVVRIINGAVISAKAKIDQQLHEARHHTKRVIHALHKSQDKNATFEHENNQLKGLLSHHGISAPDLTDSRKNSSKPLLPNIETELREE